MPAAPMQILADAAEKPEVSHRGQARQVATDQEGTATVDQHGGDRLDRILRLRRLTGKQEGHRHENHEENPGCGVEATADRVRLAGAHTIV